jgi:hypothetical protein
MTFSDFLDSADLVFVGRVLERDPPPGIASGLMTITQRVRYEVQTVLRGAAAAARLDVHHLVIQDSKTGNAPGTPAGLSDTLFRRGAALLVLAQSSDDPDNPGRQRFETTDADDSVFELSVDVQNRIRTLLPGGVFAALPFSTRLTALLLLLLSLALLVASLALALFTTPLLAVVFGLAAVAASLLLLGAILDRR